MRAKNIAFGGIEFEYFLDMGFFVVSAQLRRLFLRATGLDMPEFRKNIHTRNYSFWLPYLSLFLPHLNFNQTVFFSFLDSLNS